MTYLIAHLRKHWFWWIVNILAAIPLLHLLWDGIVGNLSANPVKEMGWGEVSVPDNAVAHEWFGDMTGFNSFHWHGEAFSIPQGGTCILSSPYCENQAFALGMHLGMQCHVEMTERLVIDWCSVGAEELASLDEPSVQPLEEIEKDLPERVAALNAVAERLYEKWIVNLK